MWPYALLTKAAKAAGGPALFVKKILLVGAIGGVVLTTSTFLLAKTGIRLYKQIKENKDTPQRIKQQ